MPADAVCQCASAVCHVCDRVSRVDLRQSRKLEDVCYDIRGPVLEEAKRLEDEGRRIIKLNIGNPAPFGFEAPDEILVDVVRNLPTSQGYSRLAGAALGPDRDRAALPGAWHRHRRRRRHLARQRGQRADHDGAAGACSTTATRCSIPAPDYPLWTASTSSRRRHARCTTCATKRNGWLPDIDDLRSKITATHQGDRRHQPEQPDRRRIPRRGT